MKVGIVGLGKMGEAIAHRVMQHGHEVFGYDSNQEFLHKTSLNGIKKVDSIEGLAEKVRIFWLMIPAGAVDTVLDALKRYVHANDIIIDGGNSKFTDSIRRAEELKEKNVYFLDCGTSGGLRGRETGFSLMVGGNRDAYATITPLFKAVAAPEGFAYMGRSGTGHYVKMVHNGIEYALMQSYAEGFNLLHHGSFKNELDLEKVASVWQHGSVIRSWLLELCHEILEEPKKMEEISGSVAESGMAQWTVDDAQKHHVPVQLIEDALQIRFWSQKTGGNYATKIVAMLRNKFGGHAVKKQ